VFFHRAFLAFKSRSSFFFWVSADFGSAYFWQAGVLIAFGPFFVFCIQGAFSCITVLRNSEFNIFPNGMIYPLFSQ
jgi:hypothetical protein